MRLRRQRLRLPAAALAIIGLVLMLYPPVAEAAALEATGWWWRPQTASLPAPLPPPPDVGPEQLLVQGQPEGATAVAALRFTLNEDEASPVLTIKPADGSQVPATAIVLACRAVVPWAPAQAGAWENKPIVDCATSVQGIAGEAGALVFAAEPLLSGPVLDLVLVPGTTPDGPPGANGSVFSLKFDRPGPDALATTSGSSSTGGTFTESVGSSPDSGSEAFGSTAPSDTGVASPAFAGPPAPSGVDVAPAAEAALPPQQQANPGAVGYSPPGLTPAANAGDDDADTRTRTLGFLVLVASAGLLFWSSATPGLGTGVAAPAGEVASVASGGLGRFARPRLGPPPPLS